MIHVREMKNPLFIMRSKAHIIINLKHIKVFRVCARRLIYLRFVTSEWNIEYKFFF